MAEASETESIPTPETTYTVVSRVLNLSIFFIGIGVYAVAGLALHQTELLAEYYLTYFAVGVVVGIVGLLLGGLTR